MVEGAIEAGKPRAGQGEALLQGRIEFHPARKPFSAATGIGSGDLRLEALNLSSGSRRPAGPTSAAAVSSSGASGRRSDGGELHQRGLDPELRFEITFRRIGAGLANLGNTCFLNSVVQCLTYTEPFAAYLQSGKHKSSCRTAGFCAMCALQNHVMDALRSTGKILRPFHLVKNLRCISRNFRISRQEDAHEYMVNLLESMHKCCLPSGIASESPNAYEKSLVHKIFGGRLRSQVKCLQCSYCSNKFDPFLDLSLEIMRADTLHKALSHFTAVEQLDGGEKQYQCQRCKQKVRAVKQLTIDKAPYVLTVHLKRFGSALPGQKINKKVDFEPTLDLKRYVSDPCEGNLKYTLYGVLVHAGFATHSGHYYCFVRTSSGMWYSLNDDEVFQVSEKTVLQQKAYMLFYVRNIRSSDPKRALDVVCNEKRLANAPGSKDLPVYYLDSKKASQDCPTEDEPKKVIQESPRESGHKKYNAIPKTGISSLAAPTSMKDVSMEEHLVKKTSISPWLLAKDSQKSTLSEEYIFHSWSKVSSIKEPSATISLLSGAIGDCLVAEGLIAKASSRGNCNQLFGKDFVQPALSKEKSVCSVDSGPATSASASGNIVAANSLVENCNAAPASARSTNMKGVLTVNSTVDVDMSNLHAMHLAKGSTILNPNPEEILTGAMHEKHDAQNIQAQVNGMSCKAHCFLDHGHATLSNHSSAIGCPEALQVAQLQCQDTTVDDERSTDAATAKVIENNSKKSVQGDLINSKFSTLYCSPRKKAAGCTVFDKLVRKQKVRKHSHIRNVKFGPRGLFLTHLNVLKKNVKKKKHQRIKKHCLDVKCSQRYGTLIQGDAETSASVMHDVIDVGLVHLTKKKPCKSLQRENGVAKKNVKKKKHQRTKKHRLDIKCSQRYGTLIQGDAETSASVMHDVIDVGLVHLTKKKPCKSSQRENGVVNDSEVVHPTKKKRRNSLVRDVNIVSGGSLTAKDSDTGKRHVKHSPRTSLKWEERHSTGEACTYSNSSHHVSRNLSRSNSGEVTVARWDDIDLPPEVASISNDEPKSIGFMLDEWEKEYDRGKRKKVKKSRRLSGGGDHFRDITAVRTQKKMKMDQTSSGNKPFRIHG